MILNEYRYKCTFDDKQQAEEYYNRLGLEIVEGNVTRNGTYEVLEYESSDNYESVDFDEDYYREQQKKYWEEEEENEKVRKNAINQEFKKFLKRNNLNLGEHNIIRTGDDYRDVLKKLKEFEKEYDVKIPISNHFPTQGEETFVQLKSDEIE